MFTGRAKLPDDDGPIGFARSAATIVRRSFEPYKIMVNGLCRLRSYLGVSLRFYH